MTAQDPILETTALGKLFGEFKAVDSVDFLLAERELRCLIGPNGAGKTTFFKMLTGQYRPSAGAIKFSGKDITGYEQHALSRLGMGIKNQIPDVMDGLTVYENLWLAANAKVERVSVRAAVEEMATLLELGGIMSRRVGELSHGQRQWVEIAMVTAGKPRLVLLDEPAAGMSKEESARTVEFIRTINKNAAVVVVEHDMEFVRQIAQKVSVFHQGNVLTEGSFEHVIRDPRVQDVYLGRGEV